MKTTRRGFPALHVDYCPIQVRERMWRRTPSLQYAIVEHDCIYCKHCLYIDPQHSAYIRCNGHIPSNELYQPKSCI